MAAEYEQAAIRLHGHFTKRHGRIAESPGVKAMAFARRTHGTWPWIDDERRVVWVTRDPTVSVAMLESVLAASHSFAIREVHGPGNALNRCERYFSGVKQFPSVVSTALEDTKPGGLALEVALRIAIPVGRRTVRLGAEEKPLLRIEMARPNSSDADGGVDFEPCHLGFDPLPGAGSSPWDASAAVANQSPYELSAKYGPRPTNPTTAIDRSGSLPNTFLAYDEDTLQGRVSLRKFFECAKTGPADDAPIGDRRLHCASSFGPDLFRSRDLGMLQAT